MLIIEEKEKQKTTNLELNSTYLRMLPHYHRSNEQYNVLNQQMSNAKEQMVVFAELFSKLYEEIESIDSSRLETNIIILIRCFGFKITVHTM